MDTVIQNTITNHKIMLDQHCKAIVGNQEMLARMIHEFVRKAMDDLVSVFRMEHIQQIVRKEHYGQTAAKNKGGDICRIQHAFIEKKLQQDHGAGDHRCRRCGANDILCALWHER